MFSAFFLKMVPKAVRKYKICKVYRQKVMEFIFKVIYSIQVEEEKFFINFKGWRIWNLSLRKTEALRIKPKIVERWYQNSLKKDK